MIRGLGGFIEVANALLIGTGFVGAAIFYLFVEILRYPLAQTPTLGPWRWMRYSWMALFLLIGVAALAAGLALLVNLFNDMFSTLSHHLPAPIASVLMFIIGLFLPFSSNLRRRYPCLQAWGGSAVSVPFLAACDRMELLWTKHSSAPPVSNWTLTAMK